MWIVRSVFRTIAELESQDWLMGFAWVAVVYFVYLVGVGPKR